MVESTDLKLKEAAAALRLHPETLRRWLIQNQVRGFKMGRTKGGWRIPQAEIERLRSGDGHQASPAHD